MNKWIDFSKLKLKDEWLDVLVVKAIPQTDGRFTSYVNFGNFDPDNDEIDLPAVGNKAKHKVIGDSLPLLQSEQHRLHSLRNRLKDKFLVLGR